MPAACGVDELCSNAHSLAGTADRAFEHRTHGKLAADSADVDRASLVGEAGIARDDHQTADLRQIGDDVIADAIGEVLLFGIARHVGKRQNGDRRRLDVRLWITGVGPIGGGIRLAGMPLPDPDRTIDILDAYVAAILETN